MVFLSRSFQSKECLNKPNLLQRKLGKFARNIRNILHTLDDILRQLEIKRESFSLFLTDAARYMSLAGKTLKELYPFLMHVTCVAHILHSCAMRVRAHFKNIDELIATIKAATIKNKDRKKRFS